MVWWPATRVIVPRPFQKRAVDSFFKHAPQAAAEGRPVRMQFALGSGKSYTYAMIIHRDLQRNPGSRYVVFVPNVRSAHNALRTLGAFNLEAAVVTTTQSELSPAPVLICAYPHAFKLGKEKFRIKIVDEVELFKDPSPYAQIIRSGVAATWQVDLSHAFPATCGVDFTYDFDSAVRDGYVCDVKREYFLMDEGSDRVGRVLDQIVNNREKWAPMVVIWKTGAAADDAVAKLRRAGVSAVSTFGMKKKVRERVVKQFSAGKFQALCLFTASADLRGVELLRTAVLGHAHTRCLTDVHRALCKPHPSKDHATLVFPVDLAEIGSDPLQGIFDRSPKIRKSNSPRIRRTEEAGQATVLGVVVCNRTTDSDSIFAAKLELLKQSVKRLGGELPVFTTSEDREDLRAARWIMQLNRKFMKGALGADHAARLRELPAMAERMESWDAKRRASVRIRMQRLRAYADRSGGTLPQDPSNIEDQRIARALTRLVDQWSAGKLSGEEVQQLQEMFGITNLQEGLDWAGAFASSPAEQDRGWLERYDALVDWFGRGRRVPSLHVTRYEERRLALWLRVLRQQYLRGELPRRRQDLLEALPGLSSVVASWRNDTADGGLSSWDQTAKTFEVWTKKERRRTRVKGIPQLVVTRKNERELGHWLRNAYKDYLLGTLTPSQAERLLAVLGVSRKWRSETVVLPEECWSRMLRKLEERAAAHGGALPSCTDAEDPDDRRLAFFAANAGNLVRHGLAPEGDLQRIQDLLGLTSEVQMVDA